ncbi:MAG: RAMP superfamily CRISPR-associated protein [Acidobacteriota bacterium]
MNKKYCYDKQDPQSKTFDYYCVEIIPIEKLPFVEHSFIHKNNFSGQLFIRIIAESDLFIGAGEAEVKNNKQVIKFARVGDKIVIPGSSLKGTIRIYSEALSPSCLDANCDGDDFCPTCRIFGAKNYQGRIFFNDTISSNAKSKEAVEIFQRWGPREWKACEGRKFYFFDHPNLSQGRKERIETIKKDAQFDSSIEFTNFENWELGLFLLSMGCDKNHMFSLKLGGAKNRKHGKVRIELDARKSLCIKGESYSKRWLGNKLPQTDFQSFITEYWNKCGEWNIKTKVEAIIRKFQKGAPDEIKI